MWAVTVCWLSEPSSLVASAGVAESWSRLMVSQWVTSALEKKISGNFLQYRKYIFIQE
jgi:hypothetical protein